MARAEQERARTDTDGVGGRRRKCTRKRTHTGQDNQDNSGSTALAALLRFVCCFASAHTRAPTCRLKPFAKANHICFPHVPSAPAGQLAVTIGLLKPKPQETAISLALTRLITLASCPIMLKFLETDGTKQPFKSNILRRLLPRHCSPAGLGKYRS